MVNREEKPASGAPERDLAITYAPATARAGLAALLALDDVLASVLRGKGEPMLAQMRLTWWYDAIAALDASPPPAQPELVALAGAVVGHGVSGAEVAGMIVGWEALLDAPVLDDAALAAHADGRGAGLFACAARLTGASDAGVAAAGRGWALADLARNLTDETERARAAAMARSALAEAFAAPWPARLRGLGALALLARMDLDVPIGEAVPHGAPRRVGRLLWHRLTGR